MRGEQNGLLLGFYLFNDVVNLAANLRVKTGGRLVQENYLGVIHQSHGQREALFLAAGELAVESIAFFIELKPLQQIIRIGASAIEFREQLDRFLHADFIGQGSGLQNGADHFLEAVAALFRIEAADAREAAIRRAHAFQYFHRGGFARAVGAEKAEDFSLFDGKIHAAQSSYGAVILIKALDLDNGFRHEIVPCLFERSSISQSPEI